MDERFEQVKALVEAWGEEWGCGPFEDCLPEAEDLRKLNALTGQTWAAEDVREVCFEYSSHNSLEETVYFLMHGDYPEENNVNLVFYKLKPGAKLEPEMVYEKYRLGGQLKALFPLPMEEITEALKTLPGFREHPWNHFQPDFLRMDCLDQPNPWSDVHFVPMWYGGRKNPRQDHLLRVCCHNLTEPQLKSIQGCMETFALPLQYREEDAD